MPTEIFLIGFNSLAIAICLVMPGAAFEATACL
jgi:hypothetical protein